MLDLLRAGYHEHPHAIRYFVPLEYPGCKFKIDKKGCEAFQVTCKAQQEITTSEAASGITAQIVAAMTFMGRGPDGSSDNPGSSFAVFSKAKGAWTRAETSPVNLSSCAPA